MPKQAIIIGAGPAGLTAAYELLQRTDIIPIILEKTDGIGGISRTIDYKGNRMDMGPHRFFSKSDRVMDWWLNIMPLEDNAAKSKISYQNKSREIEGRTAPKDPNKVMLVIQRLTRIYFLRKFFAYPIQLSLAMLRALGFLRTLKILVSFFWIRLFPRKPEKSLEDFIINKFGKQLYLLFFKDYTEKVWGIPPGSISAEWGAQRIKGVSLGKAISQAVKSLGKGRKKDLAQKGTETSLIEQFLYPKYGPGSLWEEVARQVQEKGGQLHLHQDVQHINVQNGRIASITTSDSRTGQSTTWEGDYFFSTMPVQELVKGMGQEVPADVREIAAGLQYRDFINVGVLLKQLTDKKGDKLILKDNWIYIQERDVKVGRLMIYNNWGGGMIKDPDTVWIGMEYFCNKTDAFWAESDDSIQAAAIHELEKMELAKASDVLDTTVRRMEKTYPAYFGTYDQFEKIRVYTDKFENLFLVGRNGMHKYNNADHSMLTAMVAVDNISEGIVSKENIWAINTEQEYHEEKKISSYKNPSLKAPEKFSEYLWNYKPNKAFFWVAGIGLLLQFIIFKILYPYASFISGDSYVYLESAYLNLDVNIYPVGYSKFLRLFSIFTKSDTALVAFQYLAIQLSALWFLFTLFFIYSPGRLTKWLLILLIVFNPVFLYMSNYVSSDSLFLALSLCWFTLLIWIIRSPNIHTIAWQIIILCLAFMFRYNALYYPLLGALAFLLSRQSVTRKIIGIAASIAVVVGFILYTSSQYYQMTGIRQFTPFSGWQMANNAMYAYRYVDSQHVQKVPPKFQVLDKMVRHFFDTSRNLTTHPSEMIMASTIYMWDPTSPLQMYMMDHTKKDSARGILIRWAAMGPLYSAYGSYLIAHYPSVYLKYYLWPNAIKYYTPPGEFLSQYNMGRDSVAPIAQGWFQYKTRKIRSAFKDLNVKVLDFMPILSAIMNVLFLLGGICIIMLKGIKPSAQVSRILLLAIMLWLCNFGFSVFASPVTLRYQLFVIIIFSSFALIWLDDIYKSAFTKAQIQNI